jgi:hypothetical protein
MTSLSVTNSRATPDTTTGGATGRHTADTPERRLRAVLSVNAVTSLTTGAVGLAAAGWWSDRLGIGSTAWTRIVSAGLIVFAIEVLLVARSRPRRLRTGAVAVSVADIAWVAATIAVIAAGALNGTGVALGTAVGLVVADFALLQLWFRSRMAAE